MIRSDCRRVTANNEDSMHRYYLRAPEHTVDDLLATVYESGPVTRGITDKISVSYMHEFIEELRSEGKEIFFAAVERIH